MLSDRQACMSIAKAMARDRVGLSENVKALCAFLRGEICGNRCTIDQIFIKLYNVNCNYIQGLREYRKNCQEMFCNLWKFVNIMTITFALKPMEEVCFLAIKNVRKKSSIKYLVKKCKISLFIKFHIEK